MKDYKIGCCGSDGVVRLGSGVLDEGVGRLDEFLVWKKVDLGFGI